MKEKEYPFFKKGDLIIYALILVLAVVSCVLVFNLKSEGEVFVVRYKGETIMQGKIYGDVDFDSSFVKKTGDCTYEIVTEKGKNVIVIDKTKKDVFVKESDCHGEECMGMSLKKGGIICSPHSLVIKFYYDSTPQVG